MKHLIFDCGGVIVYPRLGDWSLPFGLANLLGPRAGDIYTSKYLLAHRQCAKWLDESRLVPDTREERRLRREYLLSINALMEWRLSPADIERLADDFTGNIRRYGFFEDVAVWFERWKPRHSLSVLSDAMPSILDFMRQAGLYGYLDAAVISTQVGALKPDRRMYEAILRALNAEPEDCLFIDDRACNVEGAAALGMRAVQMARPEFLPDALWNGPVVDSFEALNRLIEA